MFSGYEKAIDLFIQADTYRNECCADVMERDMCDECPLLEVHKCLHETSICGSCITTNEYEKFICFVGDVDTMNDPEDEKAYQMKDERW